MRKKRDGGIEWIGEIPEHWKLERLQWHISEIKESNKPEKSRQVLSLTNKRGVIPYEEKGAQGNVAKEDYSQYKLAYPGTIVANSMNILIGSVGRCDYFGCVSPVYYVYKPNEGENIDFINYMFQMERFQKELRRYANGILEIRLRVSSDGILKREMAFPPLDEQASIVSFLDQKCAQVDILTANVQAQIEKLKSYKQSVITEVVTKGLNPTAPMKDSGFEWIGEIPTHWEITRKLAFVTTEGISYGIVKLFDPDDVNGVKVLRCSDVLDGWIKTYNIRTVTQEVSNEYARTLLSGGEVVVNVRGSLGGCAVVPKTMAGYNIAREVAKIALNDSMCNRYVMYYLLSRCFVEYRTSRLSGSVYVGLNIELLSSCPLPNPCLEEQVAIADYLDKKCSQIDRLIAIKQSKIEKLERYKRSLIYEYVTGKREVV